MIQVKTDKEITAIQRSSLYVSEIQSEVAKILRAGMNTMEIEKFVERWFADKKLIPSFKGYGGFPFCTCISVNDTVVHGFPSEKIILKDGDIISIDIGVFYNGYHGDSAYSFHIGQPSAELEKLSRTTKKSLFLGIEKAIAGNRVGDIAFAIEEHCSLQNGYGVVRELTGHGLGKKLHEEPNIPNYGKKGSGPLLPENCVIAIEPMINMGVKNIFVEDDNWTVKTKDGKPSAHFEHTICVKKNQALILSDFSIVEKAIVTNPNLFFI